MFETARDGDKPDRHSCYLRRAQRGFPATPVPLTSAERSSVAGSPLRGMSSAPQMAPWTQGRLPTGESSMLWVPFTAGRTGAITLPDFRSIVTALQLLEAGGGIHPFATEMTLRYP